MHATRSRWSIVFSFLLTMTCTIAQPAPTITEFPNIPGNPDVLTQGPDGALWFAGTQIGRITTSGAVTTLSLTTGTTCVLGIGCSTGSSGTGGGGTFTFSIGANPVSSIVDWT